MSSLGISWFGGKARLTIPSRSILGAAGIAWAAVVGAGFLLLEVYKATPGVASDPSQRWPVASRLVADPARPNLVLFAHPRCPCTRASLSELERIMTRCQGLVTAHVLFVRPADSPGAWEQTALWRKASAIPGVRVLTDEGGAEAVRFGAATSGHVLLYSHAARLLFSGGITGSRGHEGDNAGRRAVIALLSRGQADQAQTAVFGCPLHDSCRCCNERAMACRKSP